MTDDDRQFVREVASLRLDSMVPEGGIRPMAERLVALGVMDEPDPLALVSDVWRDARSAAQRYLHGYPTVD